MKKTFEVPKEKVLVTKKCKLMVDLIQCCPTMSPFATCGDRPFKCGDSKFSRGCFTVKTSTKLSFYRICSGDSKVFGATKVAKVATRNFGLDNADLINLL